ncbi:MAG: DUF4381 family protein [Gammaproteobacteria bacterium]|nr:DUF4381 family protein [Gammaproteobacteria bacterium]
MAKSISDTPWLEVLPPPTPVDQTLLITVLILGVSGLLLFAMYQLWRRQPRQRALRQLQKLQCRFEQHHLDNRQCLYEINRLLCLGMGLNRLTDFNDHDFYRRLSQLQYRTTPPDAEATRQLLIEASLLLKGCKA